MQKERCTTSDRWTLAKEQKKKDQRESEREKKRYIERNGMCVYVRERERERESERESKYR